MKKSPLPLQSPGCSEKQSYSKEALVKLLRWHFGHADFRGKQLDAIEAVLSGRDCFCLMPTGGGKSMCYQIPALAKKIGITLVVCPLIALMENQVAALKEKGIAAEFLSSTQTSSVKNKIYEDIDSGRPFLRLLYVTPELIATSGFMSKLMKIYTRELLNLIAIDEAHCISSWGHDFSSLDVADKGDFSEFWNRADEASSSEESISDSDDGDEAVKSLVRSKLPTKSGLKERLDFLQCAEAKYYETKTPDNQVKKSNKNAISDMLRDSSRQRLQNALKQAQQRLGDTKFEVETSATFLENECYNKYGKTGKTFYYSQVASTVRWLSTTTSVELTDRLGTITSSPSEHVLLKAGTPTTTSPAVDQAHRESTAEEFQSSIGSQTPTCDSSLESPPSTELPPIPSFSEFINSRKEKDIPPRSSKRQSGDRVEKVLEKRMRS